MADSSNTPARPASASNPPPKPMSDLARAAIKYNVSARYLDAMAVALRQTAAELRELEGPGHA